VAAGLIWWSIAAIRKRRLRPRNLPTWPLAWAAAGLLGYWMLRLGLGAFPSG
jgi:hypothetical protein